MSDCIVLPLQKNASETLNHPCIMEFDVKRGTYKTHKVLFIMLLLHAYYYRLRPQGMLVIFHRKIAAAPSIDITGLFLGLQQKFLFNIRIHTFLNDELNRQLV